MGYYTNKIRGDTEAAVETLCYPHNGGPTHQERLKRTEGWREAKGVGRGDNLIGCHAVHREAQFGAEQSSGEGEREGKGGSAEFEDTVMTWHAKAGEGGKQV